MAILYKKIILPLDGSDLATQALPHAEEIARESGAKLVLLRVIESPLMFVTSVPSVGTLAVDSRSGGGAATIVHAIIDNETHRHAVNEAKLSLDDLVTSLRHRKVDAESDIATGDPASQIVDYAATNDADLIVMSTHGRTGLKRWAYGSVTNKVLHAAPCAVLIVRAMTV